MKRKWQSRFIFPALAFIFLMVLSTAALAHPLGPHEDDTPAGIAHHVMEHHHKKVGDFSGLFFDHLRVTGYGVPYFVSRLIISAGGVA